ncbi:hypothetical protein KAI19_03645 [bacterium]|nr:hypothetical protein [bacterium]
MMEKQLFASVRKVKHEIDHNMGTLLKEIAQACKECDVSKATSFFQQTLFTGKIGKLLTGLSFPATTETDQLEFVLSSMFLRDSYNFLNVDKRIESLHFLTGPQVGNIVIPDRIVDFEKEIQSPVFAKGKSDSVQKALIELAKYGYKLHGCFHIHPGTGASATIPSHIDFELQKTLDKGGYKAIHAIFSRDGYIRFYSSLDFQIQIYGKGVEIEDERAKVYRLIEVS